MRSPFTGLRFARMELGNFRASTMTKIALAAVSLIPLIYAGLFLLAFLDPYGKLVDVPAAVVNEDAGAVVDGEQRNVGQELCERLVENNENRVEGTASGFDWKFVDRQQAGRGLADGTYYMELIIPENFSESIASAAGERPEQAMLEVYFNPSTNLIAQTVGSSMVTSIKAELNATVGEEYFDNIFVQVADAAKQLQKAVEGADELEGGLSQLEDGAGELTDGLSAARTGSQQVTQGADELADGSSALGDGIGQAGAGLDELSAGIEAAQQESAGLAAVIGGVGDALTAYSQTGDASYLQTASELAGKAKAENPTIGTDLKAYVGQLVDALGTYSEASAKAASAARVMAAKKGAMDEAQVALGEPTQALKEAAGELQPDLENLGAALRQLDGDYTSGGVANLPQLVDDVKTLAAAGQKVVRGSSTGSGPETLLALSKFQTVLSAYQGAADDYQKAAEDYQDAATALANAGAAASEAKGQVTGYLIGVRNASSVASESTGTVASAIDALSVAVNGDLTAGADRLHAGAQQLVEGSSTLTLSLGDAHDGSAQIADGLETASEGAAELHDGIADGQGQMADSAENSDARAKMMAAPVTANGQNGTGESITQVKNYGTGFAPYFISLGMWVGALMVSMIMHCLNNRILMSGASSVSAVVASYIPMALVGCLQALLLLLFIQFGLKMTVAYPLQFYLFGLLTALAFMAIVQFFRSALGTVGTVVVIILLMVQLCTAAGTFPIESELPVFNVLNPFLPMTYAVHGFRMAMTGLSAGYMVRDVAVLAVFTVGFLLLTVMWARHRRRVVITQLHRPLKLTE